MKRIFVLLTLLVLAGILVSAVGLDRHGSALAQSNQPPAPPVLPVTPGEDGALVTSGAYNLPEGVQVSGGEIQTATYRRMSYQGRLMIDGTPCSGDIKLTFRLWDAGSDGTKYWEETQTVTCDKGLFSVMLGKVTPLPVAQVFQRQLWLGIQPAGAANELVPRQLLGTVPYAMNLHGGATMVDENPAGTYGWSFWVYSTDHPAIYASTSLTDSVGVSGYATGAYSGGGSYPIGVKGVSNEGIGVWGQGGTYGVWGQGNIGVTGMVNSAYDIGVWGYGDYYTGTIGIYGSSSGSGGIGTYGYSDGYDGAAVYGYTSSEDASCLVGDTYCSAGVLANSYGNSYGTYSYSGVRSAYIGVNTSGFYTAWFYNTATTPSGLYVRGTTYVDGNLTVTGSKTGYVVDIALNAGTEPLERGDVVMVVGVDAPVLGQIPVMRVQKANAENASAIVGVVDQLWEPCDKPADELQAGEACGGFNYSATSFQPGQYVSVVTLGAYGFLKVDASFGPIRAGDLLSVSSQAGVASRAEQVTISSASFYAPGTIIGKALEDFDTGTGYIAVFVSLK